MSTISVKALELLILIWPTKKKKKEDITKVPISSSEDVELPLRTHIVGL